jgi:hypothetical protein
MIDYPNQYTSRSKKEDDSFYKPTYDYLISKAMALNDKTELLKWLDAANGKINTDSIKYFVSPLVNPETRQTIAKMPGEIRDTDLINTIRERNIGEYIGLPYKFTVAVHNADAILRRDLKVREEVNTLMQQALINLLNQQTINTGVPTKEVPDIEKFAKEFKEKWIDDRATKALNLLKYMNTLNNFDDKRIQAFYYWWATEEFYTYREIINNEVYTSIISPTEAYPIYNDEQFVEDFTGFVIKKRTTLSKVRELYWNKLSNIEKTYIEELTKRDNGVFAIKGGWLASRTWDTSRASEFSLHSSEEYDVTDKYEALDEYTIIWRTFIPVTIRKFYDPFGNIYEEAVSEDYVKLEGVDIELRKEWIEEVYIGKRFGNDITGVYLTPEPCAVQRYDKHTMIPKLPVGGKKGILRNIKQNPIPNRLISYAIIDRLIAAQQERTMAKYQGYIVTMPLSMIKDDSAGSKNEKMFYIKADNTLFYDDTIVDFNTVAQAFRVINLNGLENYLKILIDLRDKYKNEALEIANMNDYALGNTMASTGKGVMQESIYRARLGNVLMITMFHSALEKDHIADIEFAKAAYNDDIRVNYVDKKSGKHIYIDFNLEEFREIDAGVTVENSKVDQDKVDALRNIAFGLSQKGNAEAAVAAVEHDSVPELRQAITELVKAERELNARIEADRNETARYVADQANIRQDGINQTKLTGDQIAAEASIRVAEINNSNLGDTSPIDFNVPTVDDNSLRRDELEFKRNDANIKNQLREKQINSAERIANKRIQQSNKNKQK